ncbi:MAG: chromosome segregation protein SMC [Ignavibacteriae bacterium]|nr:chromosome segregation protein SMC [Ignavibacteria bacterium]MBI3363642.1 chromosome segregation protein SMC [Ignavibacteriota bacterium]
MYLSKIEIIGFKSFAQRINVNFDSGVTAIVGPNGCGKTNIVDAIRWALGEQRYSTLRSDKMEDVIFNGTKNRKPLGLAEVSLTIENTKGILPTEYSEVTITRRVFRSGESEYLLNKVPCRLKDILDLFMDTGMGSDAYSVIELKMVESILSDKTDERRKLFEEAAGVTKYKHRRKAAMRKLEDVQADLTRVNDIVKEIQKTVNSLERQAKKAEQYNDVSTRLKTLEIDLLEREYAYLHSRLKPLEEKFLLATSDKTKIDDELRLREDQIEEFRTGLNEIEAELADVQNGVSTSYEAIHRIEEKALVANERKSSLTFNIERYEKEKLDLTAQADHLLHENITLEEKREQLRRELAAAETEYTFAREAYTRTGAAVDAKRSEVQSLKDVILQVAHDTVQKRGEQERVKARIDNLKGRIDRSIEDTTLYEDDVKRNEDRIRQLTEHDRVLLRKFAEAEMQLIERENSKKTLKQELEHLQKKSLEVTHEIERRKSKIDFIRRMIESNEGFSEGAKYLLNHEGWKRKHIATVADVIEAQEKYRTAIEAALADAANIIVVEKVEDGYAAVEELKQQHKGKASFICLQWVPNVRRKGKKRANIPYVWAADVVQCEERYRTLINFLLDDVIIVDNLGVAREVFSELAGVRCISLGGQVATSTGILRGGSQDRDEGGLIGKKSQIAELEQEIAQLEQQHRAVTEQIAETANRHDSLEVKSYVDDVKAIEKEMTAAEMRIAQLEFEKKRANDAIERNQTEIHSLEHEIINLQKHHETLSGEHAALEERKAEQEVHAQHAARELEILEAQLEERTKALNELEIKVVTLQGDVRNTERDRERTEARMNDIAVTLERRNTEINRAQEEIVRLSAEVETHQHDLTAVRAEYDVFTETKKEIDRQYHARRNEIHQLELKVKDERRLHDDSVSTAHELEMKIAELTSNIEHLRQRAEAEFELALRLKTYPDDEWVDFAQLREEVKNLKERIRVLGAINFAAFDEFTTEGERLAFLTQQRDDLIDAEKTLLSTIEEINTTAQRMFMETFLKIRENFITIFKELFMEGDECDLRIEENVDPLEASIEIIAKPRGKRPTSIDLLSGGEKTLTAIALLFAIYLVKPSPFCILDEVDAPLDDSNIDRYTRILKKFSDNTQFIVVTHNKRTMEAASALYGVTMEEEGVSKIVTVRFNEEARIRSATVTN